MNECSEEDYESLFNNFDIMKKSEYEWILSRSNIVSQPILSNDNEINSIITKDSLPTNFSFCSEPFLLSPSLSDSHTNDTSNFSLIDQVSVSSTIITPELIQNSDQSFHTRLIQMSLLNNENLTIIKNNSEIPLNSQYNYTTGEITDITYQEQLLNGNQNRESNLSYVILDKASFDHLLEKSQISSNDAMNIYPYPQLINLSSFNSENVIPANNLKYCLANLFHSNLENEKQFFYNENNEKIVNVNHINEIPIIGTQVILGNQTIDGNMFSIHIDANDNTKIYNYLKRNQNLANLNIHDLQRDSVRSCQNAPVSQKNSDISITNLGSDLLQVNSILSSKNNEYKAESMIISDSEEINNDNLCLVCGDSASCQHYGVKSCEGCKGFFKRTIQKNACESYVCLHNQNCVIDKQNRNRCQYCRYIKCIKVGMVKEIVRKESLKGRRGRLSCKVKMKNNSTQSVYTVVNLLSTIKAAVEFSEPKCLEKLTLKEFHSIERIQRKIKSDDIMSYVTNELHESLKIVKQFAEKLIGFNTLSKRDQTLILVLNGLEFITLRAGLRLYNECITTSKSLHECVSGSIILDNGCILTKAFLVRSIFSSWSIETQELSTQLAFLHNNDKEIVNGILAVTLLKTEIDSEESKQLQDPSLVYSLRHRYIEVLKTYCNSKMVLESHISSSKANKKLNYQSSNQLKQGNYTSDPTFLSKLLDKQMNVQSIVNNCLLKPIIKQYFDTDNINDCDKIFTNLLSGQEIISFCPKWLFKLIAYKTMPHLCTKLL